MFKLKSRILKVKDWLKFKKPDYEGFVEHIKTWDREGFPYGTSDIRRLAENYGTPIPHLKNGVLVLDVNIEKLLDKK